MKISKLEEVVALKEARMCYLGTAQMIEKWMAEGKEVQLRMGVYGEDVPKHYCYLKTTKEHTDTYVLEAMTEGLLDAANTVERKLIDLGVTLE